jgi:hypothetical protein
MDISEGILVQDVDAEVETIDGDEVNVAGEMNTSATDEGSKKTLQDQLRRTLSNRLPSSDDINHFHSRNKGKSPDMDEIQHKLISRYRPRDYFILTDAGKPVFSR